MNMPKAKTLKVNSLKNKDTKGCFKMAQFFQLWSYNEIEKG